MNQAKARLSTIESSSTSPSAAAGNRGRLVWLVLGVMTITAVVHWPSLGSRAVSFDDHQYLLDNPLVKIPSWNSAWRFLSEVKRPSTVAGYYQPLSMISLMLDVALGGGPNNFAPLHRTSLVLHLFNTALLVGILYVLFGRHWPAAVVGLLFGLHPLTIEPIAWVGERKTLLAAFFAFASILCYVYRYKRVVTGRDSNVLESGSGGEKPRWTDPLYLSSVVLYLMALLSKPTVVPLPFVLILLDWWPLRRLSIRTLAEKAPYLLLSGLFAYITIESQKHASVATMPTEYPASRIPLVLCHNVVFYLYKMAWPASLSSHYPFPDPLDLSRRMVLVGVVGTAILAATIAVSLRWTRAIASGWLIFFLAILPTMQIIGFSDVIASDKYAYFPAVGIALILAWAINAAWERRASMARRAVMLVVIVAAAGEAIATRAHLPVWKDTLTYYEYMLRLTPDSAALHNNLAVEFASMKRFNESIAHYLRALELKPGDDKSYTNIGVAMAGAGRRDDAIALYRDALKKMPNSYSIHSNLGALLASDPDKTEEALEHYRLARLMNMDSAEARANYGNGLLTIGRTAEAVEEYRAALELRPDLADIHNNLAVALQELGRKEEALQHWLAACGVDPNHFGAHKNVAVRLGELGHIEESLDHLRSALRLQPNDVEALYVYAQLVAIQGHSDEAITTLRKVIVIDQGFLPAHQMLKGLLEPTTQPATSMPSSGPTG